MSTTEITEGKPVTRSVVAGLISDTASEATELIIETAVPIGRPGTREVISDAILLAFESTLEIGRSEMMDSAAEIACDIGRPEAAAELASDTMSEMMEFTTEMTEGAGTSVTISVACDRILPA